MSLEDGDRLSTMIWKLAMRDDVCPANAKMILKLRCSEMHVSEMHEGCNGKSRELVWSAEQLGKGFQLDASIRSGLCGDELGAATETLGGTAL
jgi:hypothetical protein